jgi:hypothetical protein
VVLKRIREKNLPQNVSSDRINFKCTGRQVVAHGETGQASRSQAASLGIVPFLSDPNLHPLS